ncbi:MAG: ATP-dependent sacrificial sulfur transferase LarE [Planctomycetales bacterium]|nr:ATP-dependent sacrificial sulfur transferase LarE [Planctomycetales bacterium]
MDQAAAHARQLVDHLASYSSVAVAFSGGVDSAVVACAAFIALGGRAIAVTGTSASLAPSELQTAKEIAAQIGIRHELLPTDEFTRLEYLRNAPDRCFHCKTELYQSMSAVRQELGVSAIVNGANTDDFGDYRPGLQAAKDFDVRSPLVECGFDKATVRAIARFWQLPIWNKPASPCLSSRVAYGLEVTPERLTRIDAGEQFLRGHGFAPVRVRYHEGDVARVEVEPTQLAKLVDPHFRESLVARFRELGFRFVTIDLEGFRSGSLNSLVTLETAMPGVRPPGFH